MSGFSFLTDSKDVESIDLSKLNVQTGFPFLSGSDAESTNSPFSTLLVGQDIVEDIKLGKSSLTKSVKKKKRTPLIGLGRIDGDLEAEGEEHSQQQNNNYDTEPEHSDHTLLENAKYNPISSVPKQTSYDYNDNNGNHVPVPHSQYFSSDASATCAREPTPLQSFDNGTGIILPPPASGPVDENLGPTSFESLKSVDCSAASEVAEAAARCEESLPSPSSSSFLVEHRVDSHTKDDTIAHVFDCIGTNGHTETETAGQTLAVSIKVPTGYLNTGPLADAATVVTGEEVEETDVRITDTDIDIDIDTDTGGSCISTEESTSASSDACVPVSPSLPLQIAQLDTVLEETTRPPHSSSLFVSSHTSGTSASSSSSILPISEISEESTRRKTLFNKVSCMDSEINEKESFIKSVTETISQLEKEQHDLAHEERYDKAAELGDEIDKLRQMVLSSEAEVSKTKHSKKELLLKLTENRQKLLGLVGEIVLSTDALRKQREVEIVDLMEAMSARIAVDEKQLVAEKERLRIDRSQLERESIVLEEESENIDRAIQQQCQEASDAKDQVDSKLVTLRDDIAELERQLAVKRAEERELVETQEAAVLQIVEIRKKFERQLHRIKEWRTSVDAMRQACMEEEAKVGAVEADWMSLCRSLESARSDRESTTKQLDAELDLVRWTEEQMRAIEDDVLLQLFSSDSDLVLDLDLQNSDNVHDDSSSSERAIERAAIDVVNTEANEVNLLTTLKESIEIQSSEIDAEKRVRDALARQLEEHTREAHDIDDRIPRMEVEKRSFAASRQFREAAAVASSLKEMLSRKESLLQLIDSTAAAVAAKSSGILQHEQLLANLTQRYTNQKRTTALRTIARIETRIMLIRTTSDSLMSAFAQHCSSSNSVAVLSDVAAICQLMVDTVLTELSAAVTSIQLRTGCLGGENGAAANNATASCSSFTDPNNHHVTVEEDGEPQEQQPAPGILGMEMESLSDPPSVADNNDEDNTAGTNLETTIGSSPVEHAASVEETGVLASRMVELQQTLSQLSAAVDAAVDAEDYEEAAVLENSKMSMQEELHRIQDTLSGLESVATK